MASSFEPLPPDRCSTVQAISLRQDCDPLRWELAITGLDWFLTPNPRSGDRFARQDPCRPPASFRSPSSYPGLDRPVSSLTAMTQDPFRSIASFFK